MVTLDIHMNAGAIWHLLCLKGRLSFREISELTRYKETLIHSALGWLLKEGKIEITSKDGSMYVDQKIAISDIYY